MNIHIILNEQRIRDKLNNDPLGLFIAHEWHRLINPYTPRDTGALMENVDEYPYELVYRVPYARTMYEGIGKGGKGFEYRRINPFSTDHWDEKAAEAGQTAKLYQAINGYLKRR